MKTNDDKKMLLQDVIDAFSRISHRNRYKLTQAKYGTLKKRLEGEIELMESATFYLSKFLNR
jgi:hypothetical protein